jgi:hypothetical protein
MHNIISNIFYSKASLMKILRITLSGLIVIMGAVRLRLIILTLSLPSTFSLRDISQEYLMGKALADGMDPYQTLNQLGILFMNDTSFPSHPSPHPPFIAIFSIPFSRLPFIQVIILWFVFEMFCLAGIAIMLAYLLNNRVNWMRAGFLFFALLALYPVMVDLLYGQLTILLTTLLLGGLLAWRKEKHILAGALVGLSVAIKMFTWPLLFFFAIKKDWRTFISSSITAIGLNLLAMLVMGVAPMMNYYLQVTRQVGVIYRSFLKNYSLWSIGYRFFEGTRPIGEGYIYAPPLLYLPKIAPYVSAGLAILFFIVGLFWAARSRNKEIAYSILILVIVLVSPISWDHYYVLITISLTVLLITLSRASFPNWPTILFILIAPMLFIFNEYIPEIMLLLNSGVNTSQGNGYQISFASSLLEILPIVQVVALTFLLCNLGRKKYADDQKKSLYPN